MESLVKGPPQRECACACSSVMNRGGRGGQDTMDAHEDGDLTLINREREMYGLMRRTNHSIFHIHL